MNTIDLKRAEFRHYLESNGVMDALSYALIQLYDEIEKPKDPVAFVRQHFKRPTDELVYSDSPKRIVDMDLPELIKQQEQELNMARKEIAKLQQMLNAMSSNSPFVEIEENEVTDESNAFRNVFSDSKYDGTLIKKHLTEDLFKKLYELQNEPSIVDCIAKVNELKSNPFGVVTVNATCYTVFSDLFEPIVKEIHGIDESVQHSDCDWGDVNAFETIDNESILSMEISCSRSLANIPFTSNASEQDLESILTKVQNAIQSVQTDDNEIDGEFYKITDVKENEPIFDELKENGLGFWSMKSEHHHLWPTGRAIYINGARTQSILINESEHLRFISKEMNGHLGLAYKGLIELMTKFSNGLDFERNDKFGWLLSNLEILGTGIRCKAQLKLEHSEDQIKLVAEQSGIVVTSIVTALTGKENEVLVEFTNRKTLAVSEFECVKLFYDGIKEFIQTLEKGEIQNDESIELDPQNQHNNSKEENSKLNETDGVSENETPASIEDITSKIDENEEVQKNDNENQNDEDNVPGVEALDTCGTEQNAEIDPTTNTENNNLGNDDDIENNDEKPSSNENIANLESNDEVNAENEIESEQVMELENIRSEATETNQNEMDSSEPPNDMEDKGETKAEEQPAEG